MQVCEIIDEIKKGDSFSGRNERLPFLLRWGHARVLLIAVGPWPWQTHVQPAFAPPHPLLNLLSYLLLYLIIIPFHISLQMYHSQLVTFPIKHKSIIPCLPTSLTPIYHIYPSFKHYMSQLIMAYHMHYARSLPDQPVIYPFFAIYPFILVPLSRRYERAGETFLINLIDRLGLGLF